MNFSTLVESLDQQFRHNAQFVENAKTWQGRALKPDDDWQPYELLNVQLDIDVPPMSELAHQVRPNLPWADDAFLERVNGQPLNPGVQWANWPGAKSAVTFGGKDKFDHTYAERYFPQYAGMTHEGKVDEDYVASYDPHRGIRDSYGDLNDVIAQLQREPSTRQAYLPIFFPEDTGARALSRVPCSLGYHFMIRNTELHCWYYMRSCDYVRHFRDDVYLTARLMHHVASRTSCFAIKLYMSVSSMHVFRGDLWRYQS